MLKLGDQSITRLYLGDQKIEKAYLGETLVFGGGEASPSRLPEGYTEVEHVKIVPTSDKIRNVATGLKINPKDAAIIQIDFQVDVSISASLSSGNYYAIFGLREYAGATPKNYYEGTYISGSKMIVNGHNGVLGLSFAYTDYENRHLVEIDKRNRSAKIDGVPCAVTAGTSTNFLFRSHGIGYDMLYGSNGGTANYNTPMTIWGIKTFDDTGMPINDYISAMQISTGKAGFYDLVADSFIAGTDIVTAGPAV